MNKQELENKINEMEKELADLKQELNKTEDEWIPKDGEEYWYYDKDVEILSSKFWSNDWHDERRLQNKVIFKTQVEAQRYADYQKAKKEYSYVFSKEEWKDVNKGKYYIFYSYYQNKIDINENMCSKNLNTIYFQTQDQAQEFIDKYKNEILEYEFGIKEE